MPTSTKPIRVPIPPPGTDLVDYFNEQLDSDFRDTLDFDVVAQRDRAQLDDYCVTGVDLRDGEVEVEYEFEFSAYLGCRDANWGDTESSSVVGHEENGEWVFDRHIPWQPRSTDDEF